VLSDLGLLIIDWLDPVVPMYVSVPTMFIQSAQSRISPPGWPMFSGMTKHWSIASQSASVIERV